MRFKTGARWRSGSIVYKPQRQILDVNSGRMLDVDGVRVYVKDHVIDTDAAAAANHWDEDLKSEVEHFLLTHPDYGRSDGTGFFIDQTSTANSLSQDELDHKVSTGQMAERCLFMEDVGTETIQCENEAVTEQGYCADCAVKVEALTKS